MTRTRSPFVSSGRGLWTSLLLAMSVGLTLLAAAPPARAQQAFTTYSRYDAFQRLAGVIHPSLPQGTYPAERYSYDSLGRPTLTEEGYLTAWQAASVAPSAWSGFTVVRSTATAYDAYGHKVQSLVAGGGQTYAITQFSYDAVERPTCTAVRMNLTAPPAAGSDACTLGTQGTFGPDRITKQIYDTIGRVTQIRRAVGTTLEQAYATNVYTADSQLQSVTDANNNMTYSAYDGFDRLSKLYYPNPTLGVNVYASWDYQAYTYDAANNMLTLQRRYSSHVITFQYDNLNRQTARIRSDNWHPVYTHYDLLNRPLLLAFDPNTTYGLSYAYDGAGRLTSETTFERTMGYAYNADGQRTRVTWPDGFYAAYDYDNLGDVTAVRENGATSGAGVLATYAYDNMGRRQSLTRGNGVVTTWALDAASRLTSLSHDLTGTASDQTLSFSYSPASQVLSRASTNPAYAWAGLYNVDRAYGVNGLNQLTSSGTATITNDVEGNLNFDGVTTYYYDMDSKLTGNNAGVWLDYDPSNRPYQMVSSGTLTKYYYDGPRLLATYDSSANITRRFVHGPGVDEPLVWYEGSGTTDRRWLVADNQGSVVAVTNGSGAATNINTYDEYGVPGSSNAGLFQYTGQIWNADLGLYFYKARFYSPTLGRFMQPDPIGMKDDLDLYAYVGDDPINRRDPTGEIASYDVQGNKIKITIEVTFTGSANTKSNQSKFIAAVQNAWTGKFGKYDVVTKVVVVNSNGPKTNTVNLTTNIRSNVAFGGTVANISTNDTNPRFGAAHEAGHLMGADDHYFEDKDANVTWPVAAWRGNIMAEFGGVVQQKNFSEMITAPGNYVTNSGH